MAHKQIAIFDSDPPATATGTATEDRAVFIDTSLDTHLLVVLSCNDTVSRFKRKIEKEHALCFTDIGEIIVHALKVKRRGQLYYLSDSMLVKDALAGANKNWFLSVDASVKKKNDEEKRAQNLDSNNLLPCRDVVLANGSGLPLIHSSGQRTSDPNKASEVPHKCIEFKSDAPRLDVVDQDDMLIEEASQTNLAPAKKRKVDQIVENGHSQQKEVDSGKDASEPAVISQLSSVDKERSGNGAVDGSTAKLVDDDNKITDSSNIHQRKKRKIAKGEGKVDKVADGVTLSGKDILVESHVVVSAAVNNKDSGVESNTASVLGEGEDAITTPELKQKNPDTINEAVLPSAVEVPHKTSATKEDTTSAMSKVDHSSGHPVDSQSNTDVVVKEPKNLQKGVSVPGDDDIRSGLAERELIQGAMSKKNDSISIPSDKLDSHKQDRTDIQTEDINVMADLVDISGTTAPTDTNKKRKKTKKNNDIVGKGLIISGSEDVQGSQTNVNVEPLLATGGAQTSNDENNLPPTNGNDVPKVNTESTFVAEEDDAVTGNEVNNTQKAVDNMGNSVIMEEEPVRKKSKRGKAKENKDMVIVSGSDDVQRTEANVDVETLAPKCDVQTRNDENSLPPTNGNEVNTGNTFPAEEDDNITGNEVNNTQKTVDNMGKSVNVEEEPLRKKSKRVKAKKNNDMVGKPFIVSRSEDVQGSETTVNVEPLAAKCRVQTTTNDENNLPQPNGNEVLKVNAESTSVAKEDDAVTGNEVNNTQTTVSNMEKAVDVEEEPLRKKSKKKPKLSTKIFLDVQVEKQYVIHQNSTPTTVDKSEEVGQKKGKVEETPISGQLNGETLESGNVAVENDPIPTKPNASSKSTKARSRLLDNGNKGGRVKPDVTDKPLSTNETDNQIAGSGVGDKSNLEKPLPDGVTSSEVLIDKKVAANTPKNATKKKPDLHSVQTSSTVQSSPKAKEKRQIKGKPPAVNPLLKEKSDESMVYPDKKKPKASKIAATAPSSVMSDKLNSISKKPGKQTVTSVTGTKINAEKKADSATVSNSLLEKPKKIVSQSATSNKRQSGIVSKAAAAKVPNKGNFLSSSEPKKKLTPKPGSIFKDDSAASSEDEDTDGSDAGSSTRTPSDYSSDYSDVESNADFKSPRKGSHATGGMKSVDRKSMTTSRSSGAKGLTLDNILRSSRRYKKAKMTASQSQQEKESEAVDIVPDSQAN